MTDRPQWHPNGTTDAKGVTATRAVVEAHQWDYSDPDGDVLADISQETALRLVSCGSPVSYGLSGIVRFVMVHGEVPLSEFSEADL